MIVTRQGDQKRHLLAAAHNTGMPRAARTTDFYRRLTSALERKIGNCPSQAQIGARLGLSQAAVGMWKTGKALPGMENAIALARWSGVCVEWLLTGRGPMYPDAAGDDPFLQAAVSLLKQLPKRERSRTLEVLKIKLEMQSESWPDSGSEAIDRINRDTGRFRKPD